MRTNTLVCCGVLMFAFGCGAAVENEGGTTELEGTPNASMSPNEQESGGTWTATVASSTGETFDVSGMAAVGVWRSTDSTLEIVASDASTEEMEDIGLTVILKDVSSDVTGAQVDPFVRFDITRLGFVNCSSDVDGGSASVEVTSNDEEGWEATVDAVVVCPDTEPARTLAVQATVTSTMAVLAL